MWDIYWLKIYKCKAYYKVEQTSVKIEIMPYNK